MQNILTTSIFNVKDRESVKKFLDLKRDLITEAINFKSGDIDNPVKTTICKFNNNRESCFYKPGKETIRKNPNIYDMYPTILCDNKEIAEKISFDNLWEYLIKISIIQQDTFKKVLVLLYRLCFFRDHENNRYAPSGEILTEINNIENYVLQQGFKEKFKTDEIKLLDFLYFVDLLGWNEDVKYNATKGKPYFKNFTESKTGRTNTILSIISAPILISQFIQDIIYKTTNNGIINVKLITSTIQTFTKTRGLCILNNKDLIKYLTSYLWEVL